jgi:hypothetical protein
VADIALSILSSLLFRFGLEVGANAVLLDHCSLSVLGTWSTFWASGLGGRELVYLTGGRVPIPVTSSSVRFLSSFNSGAGEQFWKSCFSGTMTPPIHSRQFRGHL